MKMPKATPKIELDHSMKVAGKVLAAIKKERTLINQLYVTPYVNGRERGWTLLPDHAGGSAPLGCSFAENRNSDSIVLYCGTNPHIGGAQPVTADAYATRTYFKPGEFVKAAKAAIKFMEESI